MNSIYLETHIIQIPMQMVQKQPQQRLKTKSILDLPPEFHQAYSGLDTQSLFSIYLCYKMQP